MGRILALDMGEVRVGIAITDESNLIALPHKTIFLKDLIKNLKDICEKEEIEKIVIGLPRNMDGTIGSQAKEIERIAKEIENNLNLSIEFFDETATSLKAEKRLRKRKIDPRARKELVDLESAVIILEDYLKEHAK